MSRAWKRDGKKTKMGLLINRVKKGAAKVARSKVFKIVTKTALIGASLGGSALGLGGITGPLASKLTGALSRMGGPSRMVTKISQTGSVLKSKVFNSFSRAGVKLDSGELKQVTKALADEATKRTGATIIRDDNSDTNAGATANKIKAIEQLSLKSAAIQEQPESEAKKASFAQIASKAALLANSLRAISNPDSKIANALLKAENILQFAPIAASAAVEAFNAEGESPQMDGQDLKWSDKADQKLGGIGGMADIFKKIKPLYLAIVGGVILLIIIMKKK